MMNVNPLFRSYELLVDKADEAFEKMKEDHGSQMACEAHCSDCCHAVFGLFLIEAAYLKEHFDRLDPEKKKEALMRCNETERGLKRVEKKLEVHQEDPEMMASILSRERIRCPLLDSDQECVLYAHRPITCRVYGIPTKIHGKARVCGRTKFQKGLFYPAFDLDGMYRYLFELSKELLTMAGSKDLDRAALLVSVPRAIGVSVDELTHETSGTRGEERLRGDPDSP
jgi:Fe-S-cluster containining protein